MVVVIMAGGKGTRIASLFPDTPKPLIPLNGIPVLEREICLLAKQGYKDFILTISYLGDKIKNYFGNGEKLGVHISYFFEDTPLGNAGALFKIKDKLSDDFILINGDVVFDVDFKRMEKFHFNHDADITLLTHPNSHPYDSGLIIGKDNIVTKWLTKEDKRDEYYQNRVNAGIHIINKKALDNITPKEKTDLDRDIIRPIIKNNKVYYYDSSEYVKDMGTPERYKSVNEDLNKGIISSRNLLNKQKAIFLDRDGTINTFKGFIRNAEDLELIEGAGKAIKKINDSEYLAIVITNQPVIARGEVTVDQLNNIHNKLETLLGKDGAYLNKIYYCPHHPDSGFKGEIKQLKIKCNCRKPNIGLLLKAQEDFNIDLTSSWMVGDSENDIKCGHNANCKTIYLNESLDNKYHADYVAKDLLEAVNIILEEK